MSILSLCNCPSGVMDSCRAKPLVTILPFIMRTYKMLDEFLFVLDKVNTTLFTQTFNSKQTVWNIFLSQMIIILLCLLNLFF